MLANDSRCASWCQVLSRTDEFGRRNSRTPGLSRRPVITAREQVRDVIDFTLIRADCGPHGLGRPHDVEIVDRPNAGCAEDLIQKPLTLARSTENPLHRRMLCKRPNDGSKLVVFERFPEANKYFFLPSQEPSYSIAH